MAEERLQRRLAAILSADVVGYSRLMGLDEAGTLSRLNALRRELIDPAIAAHSGRIVKLMGDGALVEFASAVDAVTCAIEIQKQLREHDAGVSEANPIRFRIGINVGDVIIEGDDILGDGVNIAARIEGIAEPGGISISEDTWRQVQGKVTANFINLGEQSLKNIARPVRVYRLDLARKAASGPEAARPLAPPSKPSIAVLPFTNMSGDDTRAVGRDLGVRSVLEGSVRRAGNRVRITAQLIDAASGGHLWAERYDRDLTDLFAVQDDVTRRIVEALKLTLSPAEKTRIADSGTRNIDAYDCFLRGREFLVGETKNRDKFEQSITFFMKALELDSNYSRAYAGLGWAYVYDYQIRWSDDSNISLALAKSNSNQAIKTDPNEPLGWIVASLVATFEKDFTEAKSEADIALSLNPNSSEALACLGNICTFSGRPSEAIPLIECAMRLDPVYRQQYLHLLGVASLLAGKYENAAVLLRQRILLVPRTDFTRAVLVSALGHLGEVDEARRVWRELKEINPQYAFGEHFARQPFKNEEDVQRIAEGLAKAGLPR